MNKYYVYKHLKKGTDEVFYIGEGSGNRSYSKKSKNNHWNNIVNKYGFDVEIVKDNISKKEALELETKLIKEYGIENLSNMIEDNRKGFYKHSEETKNILREYRLNQDFSDIDILKMVDHFKKKVKDTETGIIYNSIKDAASDLDISYSYLRNMLNGYKKNHTNLIKIK